MKDFDIEQYLPHLSIDCVIFGYQGKELKILIAKSRFGKRSWNLPGGYIRKTESIEKAASRILNEKTSLKKIYLEQFKVFGDKDRIVKSSLKKTLAQELHKFNPKIFVKLPCFYPCGLHRSSVSTGFTVGFFSMGSQYGPPRSLFSLLPTK